jgi:hypothetical protein
LGVPSIRKGYTHNRGKFQSINCDDCDGRTKVKNKNKIQKKDMQTDRQMDGWMDTWIDGWMDR